MSSSVSSGGPLDPDPVEVLRRANPAPLEAVPTVDEPAARALFERIVASPSDALRDASPGRAARLSPRRSRPGPSPRRSSPRRSSPHRWRWLVPVAALALAGAAYAATRPVTDPLTLGCHRRASLAADVLVVGADDRDPTEVCAGAWRPGAEIPAEFAAGCISEAQGTAVVREEFDARGFDDWRVRTSFPFTAERPCASPAFDVPARTVLLVPLYPLPDG